MNLRTKVSVVILVTATAATAAFPALSGASPVDDKRRQAAELQHQIDANDNQIVMLSEQLNGARLHQNAAQAGIEEAQRRTDAAQEQVEDQVVQPERGSWGAGGLPATPGPAAPFPSSCLMGSLVRLFGWRTERCFSTGGHRVSASC